MKRTLTLVLAVLMIVTALPFAAFANEAAIVALPFADVKEGTWYYNAVKYCYENGIMSGTSKTTFEPSANMTRAMFVTVLAAISGDNLDEYAKMPKPAFTDVLAGRWYVTAINWAVKNGVAAGYGATFGVNDSLTREQLCVMLAGFARTKGIDTAAGARDGALNKYGDLDSISGWAKDAVKWLSSYDVVGSTSTVDGAPCFSPKTGATRAQGAQIIMKFTGTSFDPDAPVGALTLNGNDISEYTIVYGTTATSNSGWSSYAKKVAEELSANIEQATGVSLPVGKDTDTDVSGYEILIGKTNREGNAVNVDRTDFADETEYIEQQGDYLIIASDEKYLSTCYAVYRFLEECLGFYSMGNGAEIIFPAAKVDVPDGYVFRDAPTAEYRMNYQRGTNADDFDIRSSEVVHRTANLMHTLGEFAESDFAGTWQEHLDHYLGDDPCLTNPYIINNIIRSVKVLISKRPDADRIWVTQCDGTYYCKCENCAKVYRTYGRCATYIQILQYIGEAIKDEYPNVKLMGLPYTYTHMLAGKLYPVELDDATYEKFLASFPQQKYVPSKSLVCPDNVILCVCTDNTCSSHVIGDPKCKNPTNSAVNFEKELERWSQICSHIYIWDYVNGDMYKHEVFPFINNFYDNYQTYKKYGAEGYYILGHTSDYADFGELKTYIVSILNWNNEISREEYNNKVNTFLKAYYGDGWTYVKQFIDRTDELSEKNEWHIWTYNRWNDIITREDYIANIDSLMGYWNRAIELAETEDQILHCKKGSVQIRYIELVLMYKDYEDALKAGDQAKADALLAAFTERNVAYRDFLVSIGYDVSSNWTETLNPENWKYE